MKFWYFRLRHPIQWWRLRREAQWWGAMIGDEEDL